jgi:hypothetical protein
MSTDVAVTSTLSFPEGTMMLSGNKPTRSTDVLAYIEGTNAYSLSHWYCAVKILKQN